MENKYFTPEISDLYIGYECEIYAQCTSKMIRKVEWHSVKVSCSPEMSKYVGILQCKKLIKTHHIRVPYLTKEQIEAEGWEYVETDINSIFTFKKSNCILYCNFITKKISIDFLVKNGGISTLFSGQCKDINTFRKIIKLLKI